LKSVEEETSELIAIFVSLIEEMESAVKRRKPLLPLLFGF
jgi:hypothetical protein